MVLFSVVSLRAVWVLAGSVVGDVLVRGCRWLTGLCCGEVGAGGVGDGSADAVGAGCVVVASGVGGVGDADGGVLGVGASGGAPMVRVPGALGAAPRCRVISSPLVEGAAGVAAGESGGCDGVVVVVGAARGGC